LRQRKTEIFLRASCRPMSDAREIVIEGDTEAVVALRNAFERS
jgi:hypothetical protein